VVMASRIGLLSGVLLAPLYPPVWLAKGHPKVLIGGSGDAAVRRTVEYGQGWIAGGVPPAQVKPMVDRIRRRAGRG
jgi:alkanesulfonate monooxygenase SsuD/methylene tetrahydromethanopterin reductase-like flavin-dependent oxidoreductase (luciferase family)